MSESRLLYNIMVELGRHGAIFRTNAGSPKLENGKRFHGLPRGFSDLLFVSPGGGAAFVEVKTATGRVDPEQEKFLARMRELGARAGVVRSVGEALELCGVGGEQHGRD